jgi:uncharacterized protein involved in type VI secretion and phage assembly
VTNEQMILEVIERLRGRFYGKYRGSVTDTNDPDNRGRIKALVPAVLGSVTTGWCDPCVPYAGDKVGIVFLPEQGSGVWIEFEGGDVSYPIWSGCYWRKDEFPDDASQPQKTIVTLSGHKILLKDDSDPSAASITITDASGNTVVLDSTGITLTHSSDRVVKISDDSVSVNSTGLEVT